MSFILDALKKSEIERQRQSVPGLMDTRSGARRSRLPLWVAALGLLLGINLVVLGLVLWNRSAPAPAPRPPDSAAPLTTPAPSAAPTAAPPVTEHFSPLDASPVYAPEIPVPAAEGPRKTAAHAERHSDPILSDASAKADASPRAPDEPQEILPSISEINLTGAQALPELHLDVHVYATNPADRFVYINMRKYHEGAALPEGPRVERIRRDGVVLNYQGLRFILPRQP
jgi:general secretion pathway protein B